MKPLSRSDYLRSALVLAKRGKMSETPCRVTGADWQVSFLLGPYCLFLFSAEKQRLAYLREVKGFTLWEYTPEETGMILRSLLKREDFRRWLVAKEI